MDTNRFNIFCIFNDEEDYFKVEEDFCYFVNTDELYDNIICQIESKNDKLNDYIERLKNKNINFDFYNLVV